MHYYNQVKRKFIKHLKSININKSSRYVEKNSIPTVYSNMRLYSLLPTRITKEVSAVMIGSQRTCCQAMVQ